MKNLLILSIVGNILLVSTIIWLRSDHQSILHEREQTMMRADEAYIQILDQTLEAIETPKAESSKTTLQLVRELVTTGRENMAIRREAGFDL